MKKMGRIQSWLFIRKDSYIPAMLLNHCKYIDLAVFLFISGRKIHCSVLVQEQLYICYSFKIFLWLDMSVGREK